MNKRGQQNDLWGLIALFVIIVILFPALAIYILQSVMLIVISAIVLAGLIILVLIIIRSQDGGRI